MKPYVPSKELEAFISRMLRKEVYYFKSRGLTAKSTLECTKRIMENIQSDIKGDELTQLFTILPPQSPQLFTTRQPNFIDSEGNPKLQMQPLKHERQTQKRKRYHGSWTPESEEKLLVLVDQQKNRDPRKKTVDWYEIQTFFPNKTRDQLVWCYRRLTEK